MNKDRFLILILSIVFLVLGFMSAWEFGFMSLKFIISCAFALLIYLLSALWAIEDQARRDSKPLRKEYKK